MKFAENAKLRYKAITQSKNITELFENISWGMIEKLAFLTVVFFIVSPVTQILNNIYSYAVYDIGYIYYSTIESVNRIADILGILTILLYAIKNRFEKYRLNSFIRDNRAAVFFTVFSALMIISTLINGFTDISLYGDSLRHESLFSYLRYFLIYYFCSSIIGNQKIKAVLEYLFVFGSIFMGILILYHIYVSHISFFLFPSREKSLTSIFIHFNHYGYYLVLAVLLSSSLFILEKNRILKSLCMISFILNNVILIVNNSLGSSLACFLGLIFNIIVLFICNKKINIKSVLMFVLFIVIYAVMSIWYDTILTNIISLFTDVGEIIKNPEKADSAGTGRWKIWKIVMGYIKEKPFFGHGVDGIADRLFEATNDTERAHNAFLQCAAFFGIPSAVIYICGLMSVYLKGLKHKHELDIYTITALVAAFGYIVSSCFGNSMFYTSPFLFIFLGLGLTGKKHG